MQENVNKHYRKLYVIDWNIEQKMSIIINDDKHYLNYKIATNNIRLTSHIRDNRIGLINYTVALTRTNIIVRTEYEKVIIILLNSLKEY